MQPSEISRNIELINLCSQLLTSNPRWFPILGAATCGISAVFLWTASGAINLVGEYQKMTSRYKRLDN